jgi:hypothetical protein
LFVVDEMADQGEGREDVDNVGNQQFVFSVVRYNLICMKQNASWQQDHILALNIEKHPIRTSVAR